MKQETLRLFAKLMEKGYITREQEPTFYENSCDAEISAELAVMEQELDFTLYHIILNLSTQLYEFL